MTWLHDILNYLREQWTLSQIFNAHLAAGSATPWRDTVNEVYYRAFVLEAFRDQASEAYLRDGQHLDDAKKAFIKANLGPKTSIHSRQDTAALKNIITGMSPEEAYHPDALQRYNEEIDAFAEEVMAEHERMYGKNGHHPLVTRVLRGRA